MKPTADELKAGLKLIVAVSEAIREAGSVPSGHLYAMLCSKVDAAGYERIIGMLKGAGVVQEKNHLLVWCGPQPEAVKQGGME